MVDDFYFISNGAHNFLLVINSNIDLISYRLATIRAWYANGRTDGQATDTSCHRRAIEHSCNA